MSEDSKKAEKDAVEFAVRATTFDQQNLFDAAIYYYRAAAQALHSAYLCGSQLAGIREKADEYINRAEVLCKELKSVHKTVQKDEQKIQLERAEFLMRQGLDEDEAGNKDDAIDLYSEAVELCLKAKKLTADTDLQRKLMNLAKQALDRAETLKKLKSEENSPYSTKPESPVPASFSSTTTKFSDLALEPGSSSSERQQSNSSSQPGKHLHVSGSDSYTKEEIAVLRVGSLINGREYVPFMSVDLKERFAYPLPFGDKDGRLALSPKQKSVFARWARPEDISPNPKIIELIDCFSIRQTIVSDCSFVASLAVSALYEKRFKKRIITSIIYPKNKAGEPVYNPCGKYMVKFNINGVPRKVLIDDLLPMGHHGELLCSYSSNRNEFWISLFEKAYMKIMGGYDFPGSNSNIDLHALTGWIPERIGIEVSEPTFNKDQVFSMMMDRHRKGDVLATVATGNLPEDVAERAGLVPTHAYALLDIREVMGKRLFLLKNPWSQVRWKGNYSEHDTVNWTRALREALKYDPRNAQMFDNGVFWIDYDSLLHFFDVIYLNWNTSLFKYTYCIHECWRAGVGPVKDVYNIGENPQYSLELKAPGSAVWILLTRHITDRDDFAHNKEYIAIVVYKNNGRKVYIPNDPEPYINGVRINSPHYLCKIIVPQDGETRYTLVVSQYEKTNTIYYTLRAYATSPFTLVKIPNVYKHKHEIKNGEWTSATAGGCSNHPQTYHLNPVYQVTLQSPTDNNHLLVDLKGPKQYHVGFDVVTVTVNNPDAPGHFTHKSSGAFRSGFTILELPNIPSGTYNIIPATFNPGQKSPFFLTIHSSCPVKVSRLK